MSEDTERKYGSFATLKSKPKTESGTLPNGDLDLTKMSASLADGVIRRRMFEERQKNTPPVPQPARHRPASKFALVLAGLFAGFLVLKALFLWLR